MVCDGYVKYEKAEADRSASMQDLRDYKKKLNGRLAAILALHQQNVHVRYHDMM